MESKPDWGNDSAGECFGQLTTLFSQNAFKTAKNLTVSRLLSSERKWKRFDVS